MPRPLTAVTAWLRLHKVDPQTYTVGAEACQGSASSVEVRAYPPDKVEAKLDFTKLRKAIKDGLAVLPLSETDKEKFEPDFLNFSISCSEQWKEDQKSARAFCEGDGLRWRGSSVEARTLVSDLSAKHHSPRSGRLREGRPLRHPVGRTHVYRLLGRKVLVRYREMAA